MYIEQMWVRRFRHLRNIELGPFHAPVHCAELIVLAGQNGGGKSSILELLSMGLASRYSYQYFTSRRMDDHSFAMKIGFTKSEIDELSALAIDDPIHSFAMKHNGYWIHVNMPEALGSRDAQVNDRVHEFVSRRFRSFERKLGFFIRSDRGYAARNYNQHAIFQYHNREGANHLTTLSYKATHEQYGDMYDYLVEQSYHYVYNLGFHCKQQLEGKASTAPTDPLAPYNSLLGQLFPGYKFVDVSPEALSLRVCLPSGDIIQFQDMSSGEREVFFILSFLIRYSISNSIIVVDEPELHLHPELGRKFVRLMRSIMPANQIWTATHSAELIDEAGRENTFFIRRKTGNSAEAEAIAATSEGQELQLLRDMFGYSGYIGISKKIVFTEGNNAGADRKTFTNLFPQLADEVKIIPSGSASNLQRINRAILSLLASDFARCEFFLIRDRDYMSKRAIDHLTQEVSPRLFVLGRHEIENYLLDEKAIASVLKDVFNKNIPKEEIHAELRSIAFNMSAACLRDMAVARFGELFQGEDCSIGSHSNKLKVTNLDGSIDEAVVHPLREALRTKLASVESVVRNRLESINTDRIFEECKATVTNALNDPGDKWKILFPGKEILMQFSKNHQMGAWPLLQNLIISRIAITGLGESGDLHTIFQTILKSSSNSA